MNSKIHMTEAAKAIYRELSKAPATVGEIAQNTHLSYECSLLILTQLEMVGLAHENLGGYTLPQ